MLYLFNEYKASHPKNKVSTLIKFENYPKNLHELTLDEFNNIIKDWTPANLGTVKNWKSQIVNYLEYLKHNNCKVNIDVIRKANWQISQKDYLIYSTADIRHYYDELFKAIEKQNAQLDTRMDKQRYYVCYAAGLLSFYGLTEEQILDLDLSDVQPDGIVGYDDLKISKEDMDILLTYKNIKVMGNNMPLIGTKYIRSTRKDDVDARYLSHSLSRVQLDEEHKYLKDILRTKNLYLLGIFNNVYQMELSKQEFVTKQKKTPQFFIELTELQQSWSSIICMRKKEYMAYREERQEKEKQLISKPTIKPVVSESENANPTNDSDKLNVLTNKLDKALQDFGELANTIKQLKNDIDLIKNKK